MSQLYTYVGIIDTDLIFQLDPFSVMHPFVQSSLELHLVSENPAEKNGDFAAERLRRKSCRLTDEQTFGTPFPPGAQLVGCASRLPRNRTAAVQSFWSAFASSYVCNIGTLFGTTRGVLRYLEAYIPAMLSWGKGCWDQAIANVLFWTGGVPGVRMVVWGYFDGLVKTLDIGAIRDRQGRFLNEHGAPYAVVHQFKSKRNPKTMRELGKMFPPSGRALEAILFKEARRVKHFDTLHALRVQHGIAVSKDGTTGGNNRGAVRRAWLPPSSRMSPLRLPNTEDKNVPLPTLLPGSGPSLLVCSPSDDQYRICATLSHAGEASAGTGVNCSSAHRPWLIMRQAGFLCSAAHRS